MDTPQVFMLNPGNPCHAATSAGLTLRCEPYFRGGFRPLASRRGFKGTAAGAPSGWQNEPGVVRLISLTTSGLWGWPGKAFSAVPLNPATPRIFYTTDTHAALHSLELLGRHRSERSELNSLGILKGWSLSAKLDQFPSSLALKKVMSN